MYESEIANAWREVSPSNVAGPTTVATESVRWELLLRQPLFMTSDLLKYGPLTVEGYLTARRNTYKSRNTLQASYWPVEPASIARVLLACGVDTHDADYAAIEHAQFMPDNDMAFATAMMAHIEVLKLLGLPPTAARLFDALEGTRWGSTETDEYKEIFKIMPQYLTHDDTAAFLTAWLPNLKSWTSSYGSDSLGVALAQAFPDCDPHPIRDWCYTQDDQQGFGYLVWQERVEFKDWLKVVVNPGRAAAERSNYLPRGIVLRRLEQVATFHQLLEKLPAAGLRQQYQDLLAQDPNILDDLLERTYSEPQSTASIAWVSCLTRVGALSESHPSMIDWLERANKAQQALLSGDGLKTARSAGSSTYREWSLVFESHGDKMRDFIARHMALHMSTSLYEPTDIAWLTPTPIGPLLCALPAASDKPAHPSAVALFPALCAADKATVGLHLMRAVIRKPSLASDILRDLKRYAPPDFYVDAEIVAGDEVLSLLRALTNSDISALTQMCSVLGVTRADPVFYAAVEGALESAFRGDVPQPPLPEILTSEDPAY